MTTPGSAIGKMTANEITSRPKKRWRATPRAARVPSSDAVELAEDGDITEVTNACWRPVFWSASPYHCRVTPDGGQADVPLGLRE